jgi:hypothetical protein
MSASKRRVLRRHLLGERATASDLGTIRRIASAALDHCHQIADRGLLTALRVGCLCGPSD